MKINDKYEISPFGNPFDSLFSLLARNRQSHAFSPDSYFQKREMSELGMMIKK